MRGHVDLVIDRARELLGLDETWYWSRLEMVPPGNPTAIKIEFGRKKGERFVKPFHSIHLTLVEEAINADAWTERTGKCARCLGSGQDVAGISMREGTRWRPCARCNGEVAAVPEVAAVVPLGGLFEAAR